MRLLGAVALLFVLVSSSVADEFSCLRRLSGGTVRWDMDWQKDRTDHDVLYRIVNISESQPRENLHEVAIELLAVGPAKISKRVSRIRLEHAAELFCLRASAPQQEQPKPLPIRLSSLPQSIDVREFSPNRVPFRKYREGRWVVARAPQGETLRLCITRNSVYSCTQKDWAEMQRIGRLQPLAGRGSISLPFLRFREGGWVRGSTADLAEMGNLVPCEVFGRKFACLEAEKNAFAPQLKRLEARLGARPS